MTFTKVRLRKSTLKSNDTLVEFTPACDMDVECVSGEPLDQLLFLWDQYWLYFKLLPGIELHSFSSEYQELSQFLSDMKDNESVKNTSDQLIRFLFSYYYPTKKITHQSREALFTSLFPQIVKAKGVGFLKVFIDDIASEIDKLKVKKYSVQPISIFKDYLPSFITMELAVDCFSISEGKKSCYLTIGLKGAGIIKEYFLKTPGGTNQLEVDLQSCDSIRADLPGIVQAMAKVLGQHDVIELCERNIAQTIKKLGKVKKKSKSSAKKAVFQEFISGYLLGLSESLNADAGTMVTPEERVFSIKSYSDFEWETESGVIVPLVGDELAITIIIRADHPAVATLKSTVKAVVLDGFKSGKVMFVVKDRQDLSTVSLMLDPAVVKTEGIPEEIIQKVKLIVKDDIKSKEILDQLIGLFSSIAQHKKKSRAKAAIEQRQSVKAAAKSSEPLQWVSSRLGPVSIKLEINTSTIVWEQLVGCSNIICVVALEGVCISFSFSFKANKKLGVFLKKRHVVDFVNKEKLMPVDVDQLLDQCMHSRFKIINPEFFYVMRDTLSETIATIGNVVQQEISNAKSSGDALSQQESSKQVVRNSRAKKRSTSNRSLSNAIKGKHKNGDNKALADICEVERKKQQLAALRQQKLEGKQLQVARQWVYVMLQYIQLRRRKNIKLVTDFSKMLAEISTREESAVITQVGTADVSPIVMSKTHLRQIIPMIDRSHSIDIRDLFPDKFIADGIIMICQLLHDVRSGILKSICQLRSDHRTVDSEDLSDYFTSGSNDWSLLLQGSLIRLMLFPGYPIKDYDFLCEVPNDHLESIKLFLEDEHFEVGKIQFEDGSNGDFRRMSASIFLHGRHFDFVFLSRSAIKNFTHNMFILDALRFPLILESNGNVKLLGFCWENKSYLMEHFSVPVIFENKHISFTVKNEINHIVKVMLQTVLCQGLSSNFSSSLSPVNSVESLIPEDKKNDSSTSRQAYVSRWLITYFDTGIACFIARNQQVVLHSQFDFNRLIVLFKATFSGLVIDSDMPAIVTSLLCGWLQLLLSESYRLRDGGSSCRSVELIIDRVGALHYEYHCLSQVSEIYRLKMNDIIAPLFEVLLDLVKSDDDVVLRHESLLKLNSLLSLFVFDEASQLVKHIRHLIESIGAGPHRFDWAKAGRAPLESGDHDEHHRVSMGREP